VILRPLRRFARFWFDFVVGDDWRMAAGVFGIVAVAGVLVHAQAVTTGVLAGGVTAAVLTLAGGCVVRDVRRS
jgi:hypothetical protein